MSISKRWTEDQQVADEAFTAMQDLREAKEKGSAYMLDTRHVYSLITWIDEMTRMLAYYISKKEMTEQPIDVKTIGQLIDELNIENNKIWHLVDKAQQGDESVQSEIQSHNDIRRKLVRAIDERLGERDIGGRV